STTNTTIQVTDTDGANTEAVISGSGNWIAFVTTASTDKDFNDDGTADSTLQNPSYTYSSSGTYTVKLTVIGHNGSDEQIKTDYVTVTAEAPTAAFSASPRRGEPPLSVQFTNSSTGEITSYEWDFDSDGTTDSTDESPSYNYIEEGAFTVTLRVSGPGGSDEEEKTDYISVEVGSGDEVALDVTSAYGNPYPDRGTTWYSRDDTVDAYVDEMVTDNHTRYLCTGYTGSGSLSNGTEDSISFTIDENTELTWTWQVQYELTIDSQYSSPAGAGWYNAGTTANWSVASPVAEEGTRHTADNSSGTETMSQPRTITINWTTQHLLTTSIEPADSGTINISPSSTNGYYDEGTSVTLTATPEEDFLFGNWTGSQNADTNAVTITMDSPKTMTANFTVLNIIYVSTSGTAGGDGLSLSTATNTIQQGIQLAVSAGYPVIGVQDGTYRSAGNKEIDFDGAAIRLRSLNGPANCIIDCELSGRAFIMTSGEREGTVVEGFTIRNGNSGQDDGGAIYTRWSSPRIINCIIEGCFASYGGGIYCEGTPGPIIINCLIRNCSASREDGGGLFISDSNPTITNCTIVANSANWNGGGICNWAYSNTTVNNSIIRNNTAHSGEGNQICTSELLGSFVLNNCNYSTTLGDVYGQMTVNNCSYFDPMFVSSANSNYRLQAGSPCIDDGDNSFMPADITTDLDMEPRIVNDVIDIGVYER
ncbi:MAG: PKD domain-containing protein, partial [Planctomycetota bacterium]